jgi:hypothetical protein
MTLEDLTTNLFCIKSYEIERLRFWAVCLLFRHFELFSYSEIYPTRNKLLLLQIL